MYILTYIERERDIIFKYKYVDMHITNTDNTPKIITSIYNIYMRVFLRVCECGQQAARGQAGRWAGTGRPAWQRHACMAVNADCVADPTQAATACVAATRPLTTLAQRIASTP